MSAVFPYPSEDKGYLAEHVSLLRSCLRNLTGRDLLDEDCPAEEAARRIFHAPFALLSHNAAADPVPTYGNRTVLDLFELTWKELIVMPSRYTAEALEREERARLLAQVAAHGFIDQYTGVRVSKNGRRFRFKQATVWNLTDAQGIFCGQAWLPTGRFFEVQELLISSLHIRQRRSQKQQKKKNALRVEMLK